jgi:ABC-type xylose transport system permease subunit
MGWIFAAACVALLFWQVRRAKKKAAEKAASGELRSPLYWTGATLAMAALGLSLYMAQSKPISPIVWLLTIFLIAAALVIRRALKWRYPH